MAAKRKRRKGPVSEVKREQGRQLAARMQRVNGKFVSASDASADGASKPSAVVEAPVASSPVSQEASDAAKAQRLANLASAREAKARRARAETIETQDPKLVREMRYGRAEDESIMARRMRRQQRRFGDE